jgi:hypothetical protein
MLHRLSLEEHDSITSFDMLPSEFEKLDFSSGTPSMASVYGKSSESGSVDSGSTLAQEPSSPRSLKSSLTSSLRRRSSSHSSTDRRKKKDDALVRWLRDGTVIYKSVGLGLMDLTVGMHLIKVAAARGVGTTIEGF